MPVPVLMPQLGESVLEGTITKWLKAPGEAVREYEPLLEVNTDKVDTEIPSPASGVLLEILVKEGSTVRVGSPLAWIGEAGESAPEAGQAPSAAAAEAAMAEPQALPETPPPGQERMAAFISPVVARMAAEHGIDLSRIKGTGQGGRITKKDILAYLEKREVAVEKAEAAAPAPEAASPHPAIPVAPAGPPVTSPLAAEILPLTPVRRAIAEHMVFSKHTSPHVTTVMEADLSRVVAHRQANKEAFARDGVNLTFTAYFVAAAVAALKAYPMVNSSWSDEGIVLHKPIHIGLATSLGEEGLIVPVIKNADALSLLGLARAINDLAARARAKKLQPDEVKGGTFTITNHGISGSLFATPIIHQPQCAILGVGAIQKRVVVLSDEARGDMLAIRPMVYLSLTFDHRILDGAIADSFLGKVVEYLQNWT